ncbi:phage tail sheath C-terminal domain-containing protein [Francisella philomiragia]|uniref:phage tail sheath C-terminal domain-containing protein n=1 Tax=Francisella philomiragia TaxID=28110 RepID=UPI002242E7B6|nr:phage tail sheath C-terminal domain-containing protein [Francisella philomiragia]
MSDFLHGIKVVEVDNGGYPIKTVESSIIGIVGTAPDANADKFPVNQPKLIIGDISKAVDLGVKGTLYPALESIFAQSNAIVIVIRVEDDADETKVINNTLGGYDSKTGAKAGIQKFKDCANELGVIPKILVAPEFSYKVEVANSLNDIATKLRAIAICDAPNVPVEEVVTYSANFDHDRIYITYPKVKVNNTETNEIESRWLSPFVAGMINKMDNEIGFHHSPSNNDIKGIIGTDISVDFALSDPNSQANFINSKNINTVIHLNGYKLWGNRTTSANAKKQFINVVRTADIIAESIERNHIWAVDRNITNNYFEAVTDNVNAYLRDLESKQIILGGKCWANTTSKSDIQNGIVNFEFDFQPPTVAESVRFTYSLNSEYFKKLTGGL